MKRFISLLVLVALLVGPVGSPAAGIAPSMVTSIQMMPSAMMPSAMQETVGGNDTGCGWRTDTLFCCCVDLWIFELCICIGFPE